MVKKQTANRPSKRRKAATKDVLSAPADQVRIPTRWRRHFAHLNDLRNRLRENRALLVRDANEEKPNFSQHMADAGTDTYDRDFALSILSSEQNALYEIEQALNRIKFGTYGICELTGKPIPAARLEAIPWARFSAAAEHELERRGEVGRTRLGAIHSLAKSELATEEPEEES